jgi:hypothetical protein
VGFKEFVAPGEQTPLVLNIPTLRKPDGKSAVRSVDLYFVAHGNWKTATSQAFLEGLSTSAKKDAKDDKAKSADANALVKTHTLTADELAKRKIEPAKGEGLEEQFVHSSLELFDRVALSVTQRGVLTRGENSVAVAQKIDPRFTNDREFPNQWRPIATEGEKVELGKPQPYLSAASYGKATVLAEPAGAIFFEFHMIFEEPEGWFGGVNLIRSKLPIGVQDQVRTFRRKLAAASAGQ